MKKIIRSTPIIENPSSKTAIVKNVDISDNLGYNDFVRIHGRGAWPQTYILPIYCNTLTFWSLNHNVQVQFYNYYGNLGWVPTFNQYMLPNQIAYAGGAFCPKKAVFTVLNPGINFSWAIGVGNY